MATRRKSEIAGNCFLIVRTINKTLMAVAAFALATGNFALADPIPGLGSRYDEFVKETGGDGFHAGNGAMQWNFTKATERIYFDGSEDEAQAIFFEFGEPIKERFIRGALEETCNTRKDGKLFVPNWKESWQSGSRSFTSVNGVYRAYMVDQRHFLIGYTAWIESHADVLKIDDLRSSTVPVAEFFKLGSKIEEGELRYPNPSEPVVMPVEDAKIEQTLKQYNDAGYILLGSSSFEIKNAKESDPIDGKAFEKEAQSFGKEIGAEVVLLTVEPATNNKGWTSISQGFFARSDSLLARFTNKTKASAESLIATVWNELPDKKRAELAADQDAWLRKLRAEPDATKQGAMVAERTMFLLGIPKEALDKVKKQ